MSGIQKLQFSFKKKKRNPVPGWVPQKTCPVKKKTKTKKTKKNKIKTNPLACFLGDPSRDSVPFVFVVFILCFFVFCCLFLFFLFFHVGLFWICFFDLFFNFSSNRGRCGRVTVVNAKHLAKISCMSASVYLLAGMFGFELLWMLGNLLVCQERWPDL